MLNFWKKQKGSIRSNFKIILTCPRKLCFYPPCRGCLRRHPGRPGVGAGETGVGGAGQPAPASERICVPARKFLEWITPLETPAPVEESISVSYESGLAFFT